MRSMKEIVQNNHQGISNPVKPQALATQTSKSSGNCIEHVNKIFLKFSTFYGHLWRSQFKNESYSNFARNEWSQALGGFDEKLIDEAIEECLKTREMPPALAQFVECCRQLTRKTEFFYREAYKPCNPKVALAQLQKMKNILNIK